MTANRENPIVQAFLPCREIYEDARSNEYVLIAPFTQIALDNIPGIFRFSLYLSLVNGRGDYRFGFELRDDHDEHVWDWTVPVPLSFDSPLQPHQVALYDIAINLPRPGSYRLALVLDGQTTTSAVTLSFSKRI